MNVATDDFTTSDDDRDETIADARRKRGAIKGLLTKSMGVIDRLTTDPRNIVQVKEKIEAFSELVARFMNVQTELVSLLSNVNDLAEAEEYEADVMVQVTSFQCAMNNWIVQQEEGECDEVQEESEEHGGARPRTAVSHRSLEAENKALEEEINELSRKQEMELRYRQLAVQKEKKLFELRKAKLESELLLQRERQRMMEEHKKLEEELLSYQNMEPQLDIERFGPTIPSSNPMNTPGHPDIEGLVPQPRGTPREPREPHTVPEEPEKTAASILADALNQVLDRSRIQQQSAAESLHVPRGELQPFSGDELDYWPFIRTFKDTVDCLSISAAQKLACLRGCCKGKASLALKSTSYKNPVEGYKSALEILEERFGNPYNITCEWVRKVTSRPNVKGAASLREYADELSCCMESLKEMNSLCQLGSGDNMLKIVSKLPYYLQTRWIKVNHEIRSKYKRGAEITELVKFICDCADEASDPVFGKLVNRDQTNDLNKNPSSVFHKKQSGSFTVNTVLTENKATVGEKKYQAGGKCPCCGQGHYIIKCSQFKAMKIKDRWNLVMSKGICVNCFAQGHIGKDCSRNFVCTVEGCGMKHSKYLHLPTRKADGNDSTSETVPHLPEDQTPTVTPALQNPAGNPKSSHFARNQGGKLALPIVPARVRCLDTSVIVDTYAMLDPGSDSTYCTEELCEKLGAKGVTQEMELTTIAQTRMSVESTVIPLLVSNIEGTLKPVCIPEVTVRPTLNIDLSGLTSSVELQRYPHLKNLDIPELGVDQVHLLVGQDCSDLLMPDEVRKGKSAEPFAVHTPLGWAINGPIDPFRPTVRTSHFIHTNSRLEKDLCNLWELEGVHSEELGRSQNDLKVLRIWEGSTKVVHGHYTLDIPFKAERPFLPDNRNVAERRLQLLGKRLEKDHDLKERYKKEIHKLLEKGYAEDVPSEDLNRADGKVWYLPHHPVHNPKKPEKTRIVFDCAAKFRGLSLNDHVHQGPDLANKLIGVLLRFREGTIAFMADIEAMFLQVKVTPDDRDVLRFLWFEGDDSGGQAVTYRMTSHLFGGVWSPSCANYALQLLTGEFEKEFPQNVLATVMNNFYVDDCLKSMKNLETSKILAKQLVQLLARRGFRLTKFVSNSPELMNFIPKDEWEKSFTTLDISLDKLPTERALGMLWDTETDQFKFDIQVKTNPRTKRGLLSVLSTVYDPFGCVSPFVLQARRLFQQLCRLDKGWDECLPRDIEEQWDRWLNDLPLLGSFSLPRCVMPENKSIKEHQLHHFCDASEYGYGAVAYLYTIFQDNAVSVHLMLAKSRLAPLKGSTIPRLELAGALEAVRLDKILQEELEIPLKESVFWTDSSIVLWYVQNTEKRFQTYVANRVAKIREHTTPMQWRYVPTSENPGDIASRGMTANVLVSDQRWIKGPDFLCQDRSSWPKQPAFNCAELENIAEVKKSQTVYVIKTEEDHTSKLLNYYSSWHRLKKAVAWLLRLRQILLKKSHQKGLLVADELRTAEEAIIRHEQKMLFGDKKIQLDKLNPKKSVSGLLLVGGRLMHSKLENCTKHQLILPYDSPVSKLIVEDVHQRTGHAGVERVLADTRRRYWILRGRKLVKKIVHQCIVCRRMRGKTENQQMASLPASRVTPFEPPFTRVGVDYFGPFMVKRGRAQVKRYGCIFTCLSIRAVHIEVAHTLDTDSFINALERFMARRGEPLEVWSDNGTNFVGAQQELRRAIQDWNQKQIHEHLLKKEVTWNFNPPGASHMGGVWERQIRTIRAVLAGVIGQQTMDDEALVTLMTVVEGIVNSRPITKLSDDPKDERPLTPNHLLMLRSGVILPPGKCENRDTYRRRWKQVQYLADVFWHRWIREYLPALQERQKWLKPRPNLKRGDLVMLKQDSLPRYQWPLGLVVEAYQGSDGLVRSVEVRTSTGIYQRPITKICLLESATVD